MPASALVVLCCAPLIAAALGLMVPWKRKAKKVQKAEEAAPFEGEER